uniref:Uncharacterized protein n=1 Tax=Glycine max TaxID=3847 RepID=C6SZG9_SOYBN|nr:unknown [Glycine max]
MNNRNHLIGTAFEHIKTHLSRISCLQLNLNSIKLPLESIFGAGINHLAPNPRCIRGPSNEENSALLAILFSDKIKIINSLSTLISRKTGSEFIIAICRVTQLLHNNLLRFLLNLKNDIPVRPLRLELQKL